MSFYRVINEHGAFVCNFSADDDNLAVNEFRRRIAEQGGLSEFTLLAVIAVGMNRVETVTSVIRGEDLSSELAAVDRGG